MELATSELTAQELVAKELTTALKSQTVQNKIREVGINPNHWYPVGWATQFKADKSYLSWFGSSRSPFTAMPQAICTL